MTREEKEDRKLELFDNILFGEKMIARGEATREELQSLPIVTGKQIGRAHV